MSKLYFVITDDNKPVFSPISVPISYLKDNVIDLIDIYCQTDYPDKSLKDMIIEDLDIIIHDLKQIDHYVCRYDKYYSLAFSIDKFPCIVSTKGYSGMINKKIYDWSN